MVIARPWWLDNSGVVHSEPPIGGGGGNRPKPGGGNGRGNGGANWPGGGGWGKGGKKNNGEFGVFTEQPEYWLMAAKTAGSVSAGATITGYLLAEGTDTGDFNTTTGIWTCPASGWYVFSSHFKLNTSYLVTWGQNLVINSTPVKTSQEQTSGNQDHGLPCSLMHIAYVEAGQTAWCTQLRTGAAYGKFSVFGLHTNYFFMAGGASSSGSRAAAWSVCSSWSAPSVEFTSNWSGCFDHTTGVFTCPVGGAGRWVFHTMGHDTGAGAAEIYSGIFHNDTLVARSKNYCTGTTAWSDNPLMVVLDLVDGDTVDLRQYSCILIDKYFMGFRLRNTTPAFGAFDDGASGTGASTTFQNWSDEIADHAGAFNPTTGAYVAPSTGPYFCNIFSTTAALQNPVDIATGVQNGGDYPVYLPAYGQSINRHQRTASGGACTELTASDTLYFYQFSVQMAQAGFNVFKIVGNDS